MGLTFHCDRIVKALVIRGTVNEESEPPYTLSYYTFIDHMCSVQRNPKLRQIPRLSSSLLETLSFSLSPPIPSVSLSLSTTLSFRNLVREQTNFQD